MIKSNPGVVKKGGTSAIYEPLPNTPKHSGGLLSVDSVTDQPGSSAF